MKYIVELQKGCYLSGWQGDPGRTLKFDSARKYKTKSSAKSALTKARRFREFPKAKIIEIQTV